MGDEQNNERKPLLQQENQTPFQSARGGYTTEVTDEGGSIQVFEGGENEPPSYQAAMQGTVPMVTCRVCQAMIDISGRREQHVVKCFQCSEATPIKPPPVGKKYVRCPCNCLLICKMSSMRVACPRANCKRVINLATSPATPSVRPLPGMSSVNCAHCHGTFLFNMLSNALARCPYCRNVSSVGPEFARQRGITFLVVAIVFLIIGLVVTGTTYKYAVSHGGIYVAYVGAFLVSLFCFIRSMRFLKMKISIVQGNPGP